MAPRASGAVSVPQAQILRPKVKITFDRANFQVSYGKTIDLCMKIVPRTRFKPLIAFDSNPPGVVEGKFGGAATCPDASYDKVQISASLTRCEASASLLVKVRGKTVAGGTLPGTVMLPDKVSSRLYLNEGCPGGYGARKIYCVLFGSTSGASPDFSGLTATENLNTDGQPNSCGFDIIAGPPWTIGDQPCSSNEIDDGNGLCGLDATTTCTTIINQTFSIGACTTPLSTITFKMENGVGTVTRSDSGGQ